MKSGEERGTGRGTTISLQIPAGDPDLYSSKATDDVLLFLSRHRFDVFSIGELARQTDHTKPTVTRAVDALEANDLVLDAPAGNRRQIQINRQRLSVPEDPLLQIPQPEFQPPVKATVDRLTNQLSNVLGIVLYGSVARGEADRRSDVDLWVLVSEDRAPNQRTANGIVQDLEDETFDGDRYAFDVDVEAVASIPRYTEDIREIVLSGIPVYETEQFETVEQLLRNEVDSDE
jgi:predicted nucleotidyltransferase